MDHLLEENFLLLAIYYWLKPLLPTWQMFQEEGSCGTSQTCAEKGQDSSVGTPLNSSMVNTEGKYPSNYLSWPYFIWNLLLHLPQLLTEQKLSDSHSQYIWKGVYYLFLCLAECFPENIFCHSTLYFTYDFQSLFFCVFHFSATYDFWKVSFTSY